MRLLVTGRNGQVVRSLVERAAGTDCEVIALGRPGLDLAGSPDSIHNAVRGVSPDIIVSAAAYTQVDRAESEPDLAFIVNSEGPRAIARAARELEIPVIHLSTDYVFDGCKLSPYLESDPTRPESVYGASKLAGEAAVIAEQPNSAVLRTAWVYSPFGTNFVKTMLRLAADREEVSVVADQRGNPTNALDIADGIFEIARNLSTAGSADYRGVFHMTGEGEASWAEFAKAIFAISHGVGGPSAAVKSIGTDDYQTAARRPSNSRLDSSKLKRTHGVSLPNWHFSLKDVVMRVLAEAKGSGVN